MIIEERVRFIMPKSREYQIGAMAVVQQFVNRFQPKSLRNDMSQGEAEYRLRYCLEMDYDDLAFFISPLADRLSSVKPRTSVGLILDQMPEEKLDGITMDIDFSDERLDSMRHVGKHLVQVCGLMCGVAIQALPVVRKVQIRQEKGYKWLESPSCADLMAVKDREVTGVVGWRNAATYQAAAMGLAVIEVDGPEYPVWLTKWANPLYRRIESRANFFCCNEDAELIARTKIIVENALEEIICRCRIQQAVDRGPESMLTVPTPSGVISAE